MLTTQTENKKIRLEPSTIALSALGAVVTSYTAMRIYKSWGQCKLTVPGESTGYPYIGDVSEVRRLGIRPFMKQRYDKYGEIFQAYAMGESLVFLCSRDAIEWFESEERKGTIGKDPDPVLGTQGILNQSGRPHKLSRTLFLKSVGPANLPTIFPMIERCVRESFVQCIEKGELDNFLPQSKSLAWKIGTTLLFGDLISSETSDRILHLCGEMLEYISSAVVRVPLPGTHWKRSIDARRGMIKIFEDVIRERVQNFDVSSGLFVDRLLAEHVDKHGSTDISDDQMEYMTDQIVVFVLGSHETTASSMTNVVVLLHEFPQYKERIRALYDKCGGAVSYEMIKENTFLSSFLTECMRVKSLSGISTRVLRQDTKFKKYTIPKGTKIIPGISVVHNTMGEMFNHSNVVESEEISKIKSPRGSRASERFFGFGIGAHACVGKKLAYLELSLSVLVLCGTCDWDITSTPEEGLHGIMSHSFSCSFRPRE